MSGARFLVCTAIGAFLCARAMSPADASEFVVTSPAAQKRAIVVLRDGRLSYRFEMASQGTWTTVLPESPLGLQVSGTDFARFSAEGQATPAQVWEESYTMLTGKRRECSVRAIAQTLSFDTADGHKLHLDVRVSEEGMAFRYRLPGNAEDPQTLNADLSGFQLPTDARIWCAPSDKATLYSPGYETYYVNGAPAGAAATNGVGWSFPLLFRTDSADAWGLITEANLDENFCATRLANQPEGSLYRIALPDPLEGNASGNIHPRSKLPWTMPWRVILAGKTLNTIVESTWVHDLSEPSRVSQTPWIQPGRVAWSWWSDNPSPRSATKQKRFVDLAAEMGWEYVLVDANWTIMDDGNFQDVIRYARSRNVGVLLWYNSGGPHNLVTEKPRDTLTYPSVRQFELNLLREWGVKGIKVDFFQSDKQNVVEVYLGLLKDAAEKQIMLNFHGCTLPRGWQRTYPHLMSMEAVRGAECYIFDPTYPEQAPVQNTILPFTRNAVGSMDYTPVAFSNNKYPHLTTRAHELALAVLFESGWLHFADKPEAYLGLPDEPKRFLKEVPVTWDESRFVEGYPGQHVVLARRHGRNWYIAGVNGSVERKQIRLDLSRILDITRYSAVLIADGTDEKSFSVTRPAPPNAPLTMPARGGFVLCLKPTE